MADVHRLLVLFKKAFAVNIAGNEKEKNIASILNKNGKRGEKKRSCCTSTFL